MAQGISLIRATTRAHGGWVPAFAGASAEDSAARELESEQFATTLRKKCSCERVAIIAVDTRFDAARWTARAIAMSTSVPSAKSRVAAISILASGTMAAAKFVVGVAIGSLALISEALSSSGALGANRV